MKKLRYYAIALIMLASLSTVGCSDKTSVSTPDVTIATQGTAAPNSSDAQNPVSTTAFVGGEVSLWFKNDLDKPIYDIRVALASATDIGSNQILMQVEPEGKVLIPVGDLTAAQLQGGFQFQCFDENGAEIGKIDSFLASNGDIISITSNEGALSATVVAE